MQKLQFEFNLSLVLAHSMVLETKSAMSPNGVVDDAIAGGDPAAPPTPESAAQVLQAWTQSMPGLMKIMQQEVGPTEQAFFNSQQNIAPQAGQLNADIYKTIAPQLADTDTGIANSLLQGQGADNVRLAHDLQMGVDKPWYEARDQAGSKLAELLGGMNPNELTGSERAEVERGVGRERAASGNLGSPDAQDVVGNALTFGSALMAKKNAVGAAINNATNFLSQGKSGVDTFAQATGKTGTQAMGNQFYAPNQGQNAFTTGNNAYNQITGLKQQENDINANRRDSLDRFTGFMGSLPSIS